MFNQKQYNKKWRNENKNHIKKYTKEYQLKNKEHIVQYKKIYNKKYELENKDYVKKYHKEYREKNKALIKKQKHNHYVKNKEQINEYGRKWYYKNINTQKLKMKQYYLNNLEKIKKYRQKNNKYIKEYRRKYSQANKTVRNQKIKNRLKKDINFKIRNILRARVAAAIKHNHKSARTMELIGCSVEELKYHLSKQFKPGMSWKNHGTWHIDHKTPCCKFNLSIPEEQQKCFNYTNLQPLWAEDNLKKGRN